LFHNKEMNAGFADPKMKARIADLGSLARIMHQAEHFARLSGGSRAGNPSGRIGVRQLAVQRVWD
jgi:hypothetical protein